MDHYVTEFHRLLRRCQVRDYAVFLEKKQGLAALNPFGMAEQLVLYITDRGCYSLRVRGMGEFTDAQKICAEDLEVSEDGRFVIWHRNGRSYKYARKYADGCTGTAAEFARALAQNCV